MTGPYRKAHSFELARMVLHELQSVSEIRRFSMRMADEERNYNLTPALVVSDFERETWYRRIGNSCFQL